MNDKEFEQKIATDKETAITRKRNAAIAKLTRQAGSRYRLARIKTFELGKDKHTAKKTLIRDRAQKWAENYRRTADNGNLIFLGTVGTGKDHLAYAVVGYLTQQFGELAEWVNGRDMFGKFRDRIDDDRGNSEEVLIRWYSRPEILVITDPIQGELDLTDYQTDVLYRIIDDRCRNEKSTIVTANIENPEKAQGRFGAATWDRLQQGGVILLCRWPSKRELTEVVG